MDLPDKYIDRLKKPSPNFRVNTKEQVLANDLYFFFNKELKFGRLMSIIKSYGWQPCYEHLQELKAKPVDKPVALFLWMCKNKK